MVCAASSGLRLSPRALYWNYSTALNGLRGLLCILQDIRICLCSNSQAVLCHPGVCDYFLSFSVQYVVVGENFAYCLSAAGLLRCARARAIVCVGLSRIECIKTCGLVGDRCIVSKVVPYKYVVQGLPARLCECSLADDSCVRQASCQDAVAV